MSKFDALKILLEFMLRYMWNLLVFYWFWVVRNPMQGLAVSGAVAIISMIIVEVTDRASKPPILSTYKTGRKEVYEESGSTYIDDEIRVVEGKTTFGMRVSGCISRVFQLLAFVFGIYCAVALISLLF